ncbi:D-aminoacyl-tRNA deacylase [Qingshengfaniella alkalisoli]|uniref:D-aminoacyl-tRNA deacylase n=1 Tax=Qingshengfaniella alkalisoli TaxID=2599296 RepID=A0A5B8I9I8_9RHOB|nr:D-aminoacyl-tRNA deacylase [Qingshengfaniella alkalisoli]QDY69646.1 D-tyrosyl-tRNA(Tyr) deacylase [Qingshengfaniella alkalisoli]
MRALLQRVSRASVSVEGAVVGEIGQGLLILACATDGDTSETVPPLARKIAKLRIFADESGKMNRSLLAVGGAALVVSQFTLAAVTRSGNRPGFSGAAAPELAESLYLQLAHELSQMAIPVATGRFGANMQVSLLNDGPVTIWLDTNAP